MNDDQHDLFSQISSSSSITSDGGMQAVSHEYLREQRLSQLDINEDPDLFLQPTSGFGASANEEEGGEEVEEDKDESEVDDSKLDDAVRENTAIAIYQETHPDREQRFVGGREIAEHEAIWSVSSFRPHWGPDKLRDNNALTYWQSDCPNPRLNHTIDLSFHQATLIRQVSIFIDFFQDESYTPKTISIRGGTTYRDIQEIMKIECDEIVGWVNADITSKNDGQPFRVFKLQIAILNTHLNGRDTHIRQVKVYSVLASYLQEEIDEKQKELQQEEGHVLNTHDHSRTRSRSSSRSSSKSMSSKSSSNRKSLINKGIR